MSRFNREWSQAVRTLWRARRFTLIATGTLALGIGATTALFSVLDPVLLSPLPYEDADALVAIRGVGLETDNESAGSFTADVLRSLGAEPDLFEAAGGWRSWSPILTALRDPMELSGAEATEGFLGEVLGVQPILGRSFLPEEYRADGTRTVILSHAFWTDHMGGNPDVLGRSLTLDDLPYTIVGVLPRRFRPPSPGPVALWTSARTDARCETACPLYAAIARLRPGLSLALANERAAAQVQRTAETRPVGQMAMSARLLPLRTDLLGSAPRSLALLAGAVAFALLCACVNVTTLQLARAATRRRELLVRRALGAGRVAIARLWITETVALAVLGGGLGVLIALWGTDLLIALAPPDVREPSPSTRRCLRSA